MPALIAVVCTGFECFAETLATGDIALIRGGRGIFVVDESAAQSVVVTAIADVVAHTVFDLEPSDTVESKQAIGKVVQPQEVVACPGSTGKLHAHPAR